MTRRNFVRAASFSTAAVLVLVGLAWQGQAQAVAYRRLLTTGYQHSFTELTDQMEGLDTALQKGQYASSPTLLAALCAEVYSRAAAAQVALGELPYSNVELGETAAFLSKTGDYAYSLARQSVSGGPDEEERATLEQLAATSKELSQRLDVLREQLNDHAFTLETVLEAEKRLAAHEHGAAPAGSAFEAMEKEFPELPVLLYDGPFSEHLTGRAPKFLEGKPQISQEEAKEKAGAFLDRAPSLFTISSVGSGALPTYSLSLETEEESVWLEVSQQGGAPVTLLISRHFGVPQVSRENALTIARNFLLERNFQDMQETYTLTQGGSFTVNFAPVQNGVLCYPDLIKVTVALDTGEVTGFEASGYLTHHTERTLPSPVLSQEEARAALVPSLTVLAHQLALIPTAGEYEVLCHEFKCEAPDGSHILVYVNAQTGAEEKILLLLEDENGTLVL